MISCEPAGPCQRDWRHAAAPRGSAAGPTCTSAGSHPKWSSAASRRLIASICRHAHQPSSFECARGMAAALVRPSAHRICNRHGDRNDVEDATASLRGVSDQDLCGDTVNLLGQPVSLCDRARNCAAYASTGR